MLKSIQAEKFRNKYYFSLRGRKHLGGELISILFLHLLDYSDLLYMVAHV